MSNNNNNKNIEDDDHNSEFPLYTVNYHVLDLIAHKGAYKSQPEVTERTHSVSGTFSHVATIEEPKTRLDVSLSVMDINEVDIVNDSFKCKIRIFAFWLVDLHTIGMGDIVERVKKSKDLSFTKMSRSEITTFEKLSVVPQIIVMNAIETVAVDLADIRVMHSDEGHTAVLWNQGFSVTCREHFELSNFPFDHQELHLELRLNDPKTWDKYDLTVSNVQFYKSCFSHAEWTLHVPTIRRDLPRHKATKVKLQVHRQSLFYIQNIVYMISGLVILNLLVFSLDIEDVLNRLLCSFTTILNVVAFKLNYASTLPKVSYNTLIDVYILENFIILGFMSLLVVIPSFYKHDEDYSQYLNLIMLFVSIAMVVINLGTWYIRVRLSDSKSSKMPVIMFVSNQLWYCFRFSSPHYLDELPEHPQPLVSKKSSNQVIK
eukprot:gene8752-11825_t